MFPINSQKAIDTRLPVIVADYQVLACYDKPLLYSGRNEYGLIVVGSPADLDDSGRVARHFCVLLTQSTYTSFLNGSMSYREVIMAAVPVFVVDRSYDGTTMNVYAVSADEIPEDYLPGDFYLSPSILAEAREIWE